MTGAKPRRFEVKYLTWLDWVEEMSKRGYLICTCGQVISTKEGIWWHVEHGHIQHPGERDHDATP